MKVKIQRSKLSFLSKKEKPFEIRNATTNELIVAQIASKKEAIEYCKLRDLQIT